MLLFEPHLSGADADMLLGALLDLGADFSRIAPLAGFSGPGVERVELRPEKVTSRGIAATRLAVRLKESPSLCCRREMELLLEKAGLLLKASPSTLQQARESLRLLFEAEAAVLGTSVETVRLHEAASSFDTVVGLLGFFHLLEGLGETEILSTAIAVGGGTVVTGRGLVVVPSPVVVEAARLREVPLRGGPVEGELATDVAVALLAVAARFVENLPSFVPLRVGYGAGTKELPLANVVRATRVKGGSLEEATLVEASIDDATGEEMARFLEELQELTLETHLVQALGKKGRPLFLIRALARPDQLEGVRAYLLEETPTLGLRSWPVRKDQMDRRLEVRTAVVDGKSYPLRVKISRIGDVVKEKPEDEDVRRLLLRR